MDKFQYAPARSAEHAVELLGDNQAAKIHAGGMDLLGELKKHIISPELLVDISEVRDLHSIQTSGGSLTIGAAVTLTDIADDESIKRNHAALAEAAGVVGSPQVRNVGTIGGNLCQRPRCWYYREEEYPCLKKGGDQCFAAIGRNKYHAVLAGGPCFIVHPSDCAPALIALEAKVRLLGSDGPREMPVEEFFILPEQDFTRETVIEPDEIVTAVEIPRHNMKSTYLKFRERDGFDWALSSVAVAMELDGNRCKKANIVLGGVAPVPWRATDAEKALVGKEITDSLAEKAGEEATKDAVPLEENGYKVALTKTLIKQTILKLV